MKEIQINNSKMIYIYDVDSRIDIEERVATSLSTLPKFLYIKNESDTNIEVEDILSLVKNMDKDNYKKVKTKLQKISVNIGMELEELIQYYIVFNQKLKNTYKIIDEQMFRLILFSLSQDMQLDSKKVEKIWNNRITIKKDIEKNIKSLKKKSIC